MQTVLKVKYTNYVMLNHGHSIYIPGDSGNNFCLTMIILLNPVPFLITNPAD